MKQNIQPLVSVIMPVHNGEQFALTAINSILNQTYQNFELIIVDDGSTDSTWELLQSIQASHPAKVNIFRLRNNRGAYAAMNYGYFQSKGTLIAVMDSDDIAYENRLSEQVNFLTNNHHVGVVGSHVDIIDANNQIIGEKVLPLEHDAIYSAYGRIHPLVHPAIMIRRSVLPKRRMYRNQYGINDDYATLITLLNQTKFANIDEKLLAYRVHGRNSSLQDLKKLAWNTVKIRINAEFSYGYKMSVTGWITVFMHTVMALLIPNSILHRLYWARLDWKRIHMEYTWKQLPWIAAISSLILFWEPKNR